MYVCTPRSFFDSNHSDEGASVVLNAQKRFENDAILFFKLRLLPQSFNHLAIVIKVEQLSLVETKESVNLEH